MRTGRVRDAGAQDSGLPVLFESLDYGHGGCCGTCQRQCAQVTCIGETKAYFLGMYIISDLSHISAERPEQLSRAENRDFPVVWRHVRGPYRQLIPCTGGVVGFQHMRSFLKSIRNILLESRDLSDPTSSDAQRPRSRG